VAGSSLYGSRVLVWINGPFGGGKTHVAAELQHRLPGSWVADAELPGFGFHRMMPPGARADFQDLPGWRRGVADALDATLRAYDGIVLVPMTLVNPNYFTEVIDRLREAGHDVRHVALLARPETVLRRLRERGFGRITVRLGVDPLARERFAVDRLTPCLTALEQPQFAKQIWTDDLTIEQVAEEVAEHCGLRLAPATGGTIRTTVRRTLTTLRHLRSP
jgi:gluconate kinase